MKKKIKELLLHEAVNQGFKEFHAKTIFGISRLIFIKENEDTITCRNENTGNELDVKKSREVEVHI